jgi:SAM-dependent methyltransferase
MSYKEDWDNHYRAGYNSGAGSYGKLAGFKAQTINEFIADHGIQTVLDIGCGDGNQLSLLNCPEYFGVDVSPTAVELCKKKFSSDPTKHFNLYMPNGENDLPECDLVLSLDVLYHIIPEEEFTQTLNDIFTHAEYMVILYTVLSDIGTKNSHIYTRNTMQYIEKYIDWEVTEIICQKYPKESGADFIILEKEE